MAGIAGKRKRRSLVSSPTTMRQPRPTSLGIGGFLLFFVGLGTLCLAVVALVSIIAGHYLVFSELVTWSGRDSGYTWPIGILMIGLAPLSLLSGWRLMNDGPRRPALLASLGWLAINRLYALESGVAVPMAAWILPVPFMLWGTLVEARRMGLRAALAA